MAPKCLQNQKEMENELHENSYYNILVLSMEYPTTKDFNAHFKKDMFLKSNKAAFQHIIHFLLNILDPVSFKQKVCWPILDIKMETQFRNEVMKYINELNTLYEDTGIPVLMTSHVISPGGFRFATFLFKLSQFVLLEHLKRDQVICESLLLPPKADKECRISSDQLKNMKKIVDDQYITLAMKQAEFHFKYDNIKENASIIINQQQRIEATALDVKFQFREQQEKLKSEFSDVKQMSFEERITQIDQQLQNLEIDEKMFKYCSELIDVLNLNQNTLKYEKQGQSASNSGDSVDLVEILKSFHDTIKSKKHIAQCRKGFDFKNQLEIVSHVNEELIECYDKYEGINSELLYYLSQIEEFVMNYKHKDYSEESVLLQKVKKIFEPVPSINIRITNLI